MGVNKIIVLSHSGYVVDHAVASNTMTIDVIVDGHSNTLFSNTNEGAEGAYPTMVDDTAIVQAYAMVIWASSMSPLMMPARLCRR